MRSRLEKTKDQPIGESHAWKQATTQWERYGVTAWSFGDLPARITVADGALPVYAWPGLAVEGDHMALRLFHSEESARRSGIAGLQRLVEYSLPREFAWMQKDLSALARLDPLIQGFTSTEALQNSAFENLKRYILPKEALPNLTESAFKNAVEQTRQRIAGQTVQMIDRLRLILQSRHDLLSRFGGAATPKPNPRQTLSDLKQLGTTSVSQTRSPILLELESLLPPSFLNDIPFERLLHLPRYLKALLVRAERAAQNPPKDLERANQVAPYREALRKFESTSSKSPEARAKIQEFRWMLEEFKVSLFAQEIGTAIPISPKRLDKHLEEIGQCL